MRRAFFLVFLTIFLAFPAFAEESGSSALYQVADVTVDVTADTASHARDQAVIQAQRSAFAQLVTRLGAEAKLADSQNDDAIATLVQAFEVQQERTSSVRYIGTFTVQFKPMAVRTLLNKHGQSYSEMRSKPILVLPILSVGDKNILWEESTKWRAAWEEAAKGASTVPLFIPSPNVEDAALLSTADALSGKAEALQNLMRKYQASGTLVATLHADPDHPDAQKPFEITAARYDFFGKITDNSRFTPTIPADPNAARAAMTQVVRQLRDGLEKNWQQIASKAKGPALHLPVVVPIETLAAWNTIKRKLDSVPNIQKTNVISLTRGSAKIEIEFRGEVTDLMTPLAVEGLAMEPIGGIWTLFETTNSPSERTMP